VAEDDEEPAPLSDRLDDWLGGDHRKTMCGLVETFGPQSFAVVFVILMALPALPLPTAGVTHVLEVATLLLALELVVGRRDVWLPKRLQDRELKGVTGPRFRSALMKRVRWFERFARPRLGHLFDLRLTSIAYGLVVALFTVVAFFAPPFSGLDTLPSLGVVVLSLGVLFRDVVLAGIGLGIGAAGIALVVGLGHVITRLI
jgi:hypothetical protein